MTRRTLTLVLALLLSAPSVSYVGAQPDDKDQGVPITLDEALRTSLENNLDLVIVSHADNDHAGGATAVAAAFPAADVLVGPDVVAPAGRRCERGQAWQWDGVRFEVLHPSGETVARGNDAKPLPMKCHWELNNDNLLDLSHIVYVHPTTLGAHGLDRTPIATHRSRGASSMIPVSRPLAGHTDPTPAVTSSDRPSQHMAK